MVLDKQRHRIDWWLVPLAKSLRHVHPNVFTWLALLAAGVGGYAFYRSGPTAGAPVDWLLLGWSMVLLNSVLDLLDGKVANMTGQATAKGDFLDHAVDRFSDVLFLGGIALSPWVDVRWGMAALVFTLLTSYLGTQAQAVGIGRNYGGLLGRADRMVLLLIVPVVQYWSVTWQGWSDAALGDWRLSLVGWMIVYLTIVGGLTTVQRFVAAYRSFAKDGSVED